MERNIMNGLNCPHNMVSRVCAINARARVNLMKGFNASGGVYYVLSS